MSLPPTVPRAGAPLDPPGAPSGNAVRDASKAADRSPSPTAQRPSAVQLAQWVDVDRLKRAYQQVSEDLLGSRAAPDHWVGQLAQSALSTATAVSALALVRKQANPPTNGSSDELDRLISRGVEWLAGQQNSDGGWGDTTKSYSNIATTMLVVAAMELSGTASAHAEQLAGAERYILEHGGIEGLRHRYGIDKTFAVPILTNYALAGRCAWRHVDPLPFEIACVPQRFYRLARLPVVSYAIPALVAVGQAVYFHRSRWHPWAWLRKFAVKPSVEVLERMQPASGGYLEAIPLTSFVVMSLAATGRANHRVTERGVQFLRSTVRDDGSWPIDTDLSTWNTSLAVNALDIDASWNPHRCLRWLLGCQQLEPHPFTGAQPGGWGWSHCSGAVPDADDTSGALLALSRFRQWPDLVPFDADRISVAAALGVHWLLDLQNEDGGWPTFCKGWGKLPFDRSGTDLTAHALRALRAWSTMLDAQRYVTAVQQGFAFLERQQNADGSWIPLWFGNQDHPREENPIYGTAKVLAVYRDYGRWDAPSARRARLFLAAVQQPDGGWGSPGGRVRSDRGARLAGHASVQAAGAGVVSGVEETALAVEALLGGPLEPPLQAALAKGLHWLLDAVDSGHHRRPSPIGLYFAKLWYYESLYPVTFTAAALRAAVRSARGDAAVTGGHVSAGSVNT